MSSLPGNPPAFPLRAPRGPRRSCRGWEQEAALRLLLNSRDPELAEESVTAPMNAPIHAAAVEGLVTALRALGPEETLLVQSGQAARVFPTQAAAPRVLIAGEGAQAAESWLNFGSQARLLDAYEGFAAAARQHFAGSLAGKLVVAAGLTAADAVLPLAATLNGAAFLGLESDAARLKRQLRAGMCDIIVHDLDEALRILKIAVRKREAVSVGLVGPCAQVLPELARRGVLPDVLADPTGAAAAVLHGPGAVRFDSSNNGAPAGGREPLAWVALSGEASDIHASSARLLELVAGPEALRRWMTVARQRVRFHGLPARVCWLDAEQRQRWGQELNALVGAGALHAPVVVIRERRGLLPALLATASGASWVVINDSGPDARTGLAVVADGTPAMAARLERVLAGEVGLGPV